MRGGPHLAVTCLLSNDSDLHCVCMHSPPTSLHSQFHAHVNPTHPPSQSSIQVQQQPHGVLCNCSRVPSGRVRVPPDHVGGGDSQQGPTEHKDSCLSHQAVNPPTPVWLHVLQTRCSWSVCANFHNFILTGEIFSLKTACLCKLYSMPLINEVGLTQSV